MVICSYYLQGRCRFGEKCWNEHPRGGGRQQPQQQGFGGNRGGWGSYSYRSPQYGVLQPSSFSKQVSWGGGKEDEKRNFGSYSGFKQQDGGKKGFQKTDASSFNFSQNKFSALSSTSQSFDKSSKDETEKLLETVKRDMEIWEASGQWPFSAYSMVAEKNCLFGFSDISPEELRLQWCACKVEGSLQNYVSSVQQLASQWKSRVLELKNQPLSSRASLIAELTNPPSQTKTSFGFGAQQTSSFGTSAGFGASGGSSSSTFTFKPSSGLGSSDSSGSSTFGSSAPAQTVASFGSATSTGFGSSSASAFGSSAPSGFGSASASVFGSSAPSGFGSASASVFGSSVPSGFGSTSASVFGTSAPAGFGSPSAFGTPSTLASTGFGISTNIPASGSVFGGGASAPASSGGFGSTSSAPGSFSSGASTEQPASVLGGSSSTTVSGLTTVTTTNKLFTPQNELSADELREFQAEKFTLGKIPLRPPPIELLSI